jgi:hypothetical protein
VLVSEPQRPARNVVGAVWANHVYLSCSCPTECIPGSELSMRLESRNRFSFQTQVDSSDPPSAVREKECVPGASRKRRRQAAAGWLEEPSTARADGI